MPEPSTATPSTTASLDRLQATFATRSPVFRDAIGRTRASLGERWASDFDETVERMLPADADVDAAVDAYARFALEALRLQARFDQEGAYVHRTYADVEAAVYANAAYMEGQYLPGLLLSHFLWPHHYRQLRYFEDAFAREASTRGPATAYEIGIGTGIYTRTLLQRAPEVVGVGFDISPTSATFADRHVRAFGLDGRFRVELRDVIADPPPAADLIVCVEVLEHLEDPVAFLHGIRTILAANGRAFIATAMNAANADHIYLYRSPAEVIAQLLATGFDIEQYAVAPAAVPRRAGVAIPEVIAFVVT